MEGTSAAGGAAVESLWAETARVAVETIVPPLKINLAVAAGWLGLWLLCKWLTPVLAPGFTKKLLSNKKGAHDLRYFNGVFTGVIHALIVCTGCIYILLKPDPVLVDGLYGTTPGSTLIFHIAAGYFMFDLTLCVVENWGPAFTIHGLMCTLVYTTVQFGFPNKGFLQYYGLSFLLFELSTPFLHGRWLLIKLGHGKGLFYNIVQYGFAASFFVVRILIGWPMSILYLWPDVLDLLKSGHCHSLVFTFFILMANVVLCVLNGFWFSNIALVALGLDAKSGKRMQAKQAKGDSVTSKKPAKQE